MTTYRTRYGRAIHSRLAQNVMEKRRLGPVDACQAIMHFVAAQKYNEAAFVLLLALNGLLEAEDPKDYMGISGIWAHSPLPHDIAHGTKVYIRSLQIAVRQRLG